MVVWPLLAVWSNLRSVVHITPKSSECLQSFTPQPLCLQSFKDFSDPSQWTLSIHIGPYERINNLLLHALFVQQTDWASTQRPESDPKHLTLDFYWHTDLGLHFSCLFSCRYRVFYTTGCYRSCSINPLNLLFNLDLKAAVNNVHETQQQLHNSGKQMLSFFWNKWH